MHKQYIGPDRHETQPEQNAPFYFCIIFIWNLNLKNNLFQPGNKHQKTNSRKLVDKRMSSFLIHLVELRFRVTEPAKHDKRARKAPTWVLHRKIILFCQ